MKYCRSLLHRVFLASMGVAVLMSLPANAQPTFAYVANSGTPSSISGYRVDPVTGALTPVPGSPFASGLDTNSIVVHPSGRFVYVTNENDNTIGGYTIDPVTGSLTPIAGSPFTTGISPNSVVIHPRGRFLYVANEGDGTISVYSIGASGALTEIAGSPFAVPGPGGRTDSIAIDPSGRFAYVTFTVNSVTGALTFAGAIPSGGNSTDWVVVHPSGRFVYAANFNSQTVSAFSINQTTGALTAVPGSPFPAGGSPDQVNVDASGRFVFVANDGGGGPPGAGVFTVDPVTGALTAVAGSPFTAGASPSGVTPDAATRILYVANENSNNVSVFAINPTTGVLTEIAGSPFAAGDEPVKIALTPRLTPDAFQVNYVANLNIGDSVIDITNTGTSSTTALPAQNGNLCVNAYAFSPDEQLVSCCSCFVTPNGLVSLSARNDLISNTLTPGVPTALVVKLLASTAGADATTCNASTVGTGGNLLASGLAAWRTTLHAVPVTPRTPATTFGTTETPFLLSTLSPAELARITGLCGFVQTNGSGFGVCKSCRLGGLGGAHQ